MTDGASHHRHLPALVLVVVLATAAAVAWTVAFVRADDASEHTCNVSAVPGAGVVLAPTALDGQALAPARSTHVTVLNGTDQRGRAQLAAAELDELGTARAAPPDADRLYPAGDLRCVAQIRFGPTGAAAARTLSLLVPCAELVDDGRRDATVDLAVGSDFRDIAPTPQLLEVVQPVARRSTRPDPIVLDVERAATCRA